MKKQTQHNICLVASWNSRNSVDLFDAQFQLSSSAQTRKFIDPKSEFGKLTGVVSQLDGSGCCWKRVCQLAPVAAMWLPTHTLRLESLAMH
jgi:hypothetical protein